MAVVASSGAHGRARRPGLDALLKDVSRKEFDLVAAWSVCRLGRSLSDLVGLLGELRKSIYLQEALTHRYNKEGSY